MRQLSILCPVKDPDWDRFQILNNSINKHMKMDYQLIVVSPSGKCPILNNKIVSLSDKEIDKSLIDPKHNTKGWWKQQIIKLAAYNLCDSDNILILDADCFMVKDMHITDILDMSNKIKIKISTGGSWNNWYHGSSKVLNLEYDYAKKRIGVTPVLLSKPILSGLHNYLRSLYYDPWDYLLSNTTIYDNKFNPPSSPTWTEYCLYHIYAVSSGLFEKYHSVSSIELSGNCFWTESQADSWDPSLSFNNPYFYFTVAQSIANKSAKWLENKISTYLS